MQLPEGWITKTLGECFRLKSGDNLTTKMMNSDGSYPVFGGNGIAGYHSEFNLDGSNVIIGRVGALCGNVRHIAEKIWLTDNCFRVLDKKYSFDDAFLAYLLNSKNLGQYARKAAQPVISNSSLKDVVISFPTSIKEQKRIVAILDEAFAGISQAIANTEKNLANAREIFDRVLSKKLDQFASLPTTQILTDLTQLIVDCEHKTAPTQSIGYPSIRTPNIGKGDLLLDGVYRVSQETYDVWTRRATPQANDLILAREASAGNIAVIPEDQKVCLGQRTVLIRPKLDQVHPYFLAYLILHPILQQRLLSGSTGATVQHVNVKDIRNLGLGSLPNLTIQNTLVEDIRAAKIASEKLTSTCQQKLQSLAELKQSLLQKAFSGELTANNVDKLVNP